MKPRLLARPVWRDGAVPPLDEFAHGTVTLVDVDAWHAAHDLPDDKPEPVPRAWAHDLVDLFDDPVSTARFARFCRAVAINDQARAGRPASRQSSRARLGRPKHQ